MDARLACPRYKVGRRVVLHARASRKRLPRLIAEASRPSFGSPSAYFGVHERQNAVVGARTGGGSGAEEPQHPYLVSRQTSGRGMQGFLRPQPCDAGRSLRSPRARTIRALRELRRISSRGEG